MNGRPALRRAVKTKQGHPRQWPEEERCGVAGWIVTGHLCSGPKVVQVSANIAKRLAISDAKIAEAKGIESRCGIAPTTTPCPLAPLLVDRVMSSGGGMLLIFRHQGGGREDVQHNMTLLD